MIEFSKYIIYADRIRNAENLAVFSIVIDLFISLIGLYLSYIIVVGYDAVFYIPGILNQFALYGVIAVIVFQFVGLYRGELRYASLSELLAIFRGSALLILFFTGALFILSRGDNLPQSVPPLTFLFTLFLLSGFRLIYRLSMEAGLLTSSQNNNSKFRNVLLLGVNPNAEAFIRATRKSENAGIRIVGLLDDSCERNLRFQGLKVLGNSNDIERVASRLNARDETVSEVVVTDVSIDPVKMSKIVSSCTSAGLSISRIPNLTDIVNPTPECPLPQKVELIDLLAGPSVFIDDGSVAHFIKGKAVFITGSGGSIGSELSRQIASFKPRHLILTDNSAYFLHLIDKECRECQPDLPITSAIADIRDEKRIEKLISELKPEIILHAAALKHVSLMENNSQECIKTNLFGTRNLADCAIRNNVGTFVLISTCRANNPTSVMGASKRAAEVYCQLLDLQGHYTHLKTVRFGNVLRSNGSVVTLFEKQIARGGPVTVVNPEVVRSFMTTAEAVRLALQASVSAQAHAGDRGKIFVLNAGKQVRVAELARKMIELAGHRPDIDIKIEYTGLRPGEELVEELHDFKESADASVGRGYVVSSPQTVGWTAAISAIGRMYRAIEEQDEKSTSVELMRLVPEYKSKFNLPILKTADILEFRPVNGNRHSDT